MLRAVHCFKFGVTMSRRFPWPSTPRYGLQLPTTSALVDGWTRRAWAEDANGKKTQSCGETVRKATTCDKTCGRGPAASAAAAADTCEDENTYGRLGPVVDKIYTKQMRELLAAYMTLDLRKEINGIPNVALWTAGTAVVPLALTVANAFVTLSCVGYSEGVMRYVLFCVTVANGWMVVNSGVASQPHQSFWSFEVAIAPVTIPAIVAFVAPYPIAYLYVWWCALDVCSKLADGTELQSPPPPWLRPLMMLVFGAVSTSMMLALSCVIFP